MLYEVITGKYLHNLLALPLGGLGLLLAGLVLVVLGVVVARFKKSTRGIWLSVITSYSIHYTKLYDHVDLDRCEAGGRGGVDALEHASDRKVHIVHPAEYGVVE